VIENGAPEAFGFERGEVLPSIGRAARFRCGAGELWEMRESDRALASRLLELGRRGVGAFVRGGEHAGLVWLVREGQGETLSRELHDRSEALAFSHAIALALSLARALSACESEGLFPGPIQPGAIGVRDRAIMLRADALVFAMIGASSPELRATEESASARWMPPEQAHGASWDNAANRYVLGLLLYRMIAGEHAFAGKGLRLGLEEQASRGAPPFPDAIAAKLPPGLQSFCLRMLHPSPSERPSSASAIAETLARFVADRPERVEAPRIESAPIAPSIDARTANAPFPAHLDPFRKEEARDRSRIKAIASSFAMLIFGAALGGTLLAFVDRPAEPAPRRSISRALLTADHTNASDCASCHPRHTAEWQRSVMAHSVSSPLFQSLEIQIQEQVGRDFSCPEGAGILRNVDPRSACRDRSSGLPVTGSGGELWCVNCHAPRENLARAMPPWDGRSLASRSRLPVRDLLPSSTMEGIGCAFCHQTHGPVRPGNRASGRYEGNPFWTSTRTGQRFSMRPEDDRGLFGIANSGYFLDPTELIATADGAALAGNVHARPTPDARAYLRSSEFCGACHDVRLFGSDGLRGERFRRLRNAYSEWSDWSVRERSAGRVAASCQDCHMSRYPGRCVEGAPIADADVFPSALARACPPGTRFEASAPGDFGNVSTSVGSSGPSRSSTHYFSGVDVPLGPDFDEGWIDDAEVDVHGIPIGARQRRDLLLGRTFRFEIDRPFADNGRLEIPIVIENVGAGHRVPAGFSQEREFWVHLRVTDANGGVVYEVGRVDRHDEDLKDKVFLRVTTQSRFTDREGRPEGIFGADIVDGPDVPRWNPPPELGGTQFRGLGLINFQNGFLRCVTCIGTVDVFGRCQPGFGQGRTRADRFADGQFDLDTGICISNLSGQNAFFETYFPIGSLDASRGIVRGPDAIIDSRSVPPGVPLRYVYDLRANGRTGPFTIEARLLFRAFPPFLIRAFAEYERARALAGRRPSGPLVTEAMLERLEIVELVRARARIE
jgi:eukaryotic-like serine/threonine-protein kinase